MFYELRSKPAVGRILRVFEGNYSRARPSAGADRSLSPAGRFAGGLLVFRGCTASDEYSAGSVSGLRNDFTVTEERDR